MCHNDYLVFSQDFFAHYGDDMIKYSFEVCNLQQILSALLSDKSAPTTSHCPHCCPRSKPTFITAADLLVRLLLPLSPLVCSRHSSQSDPSASGQIMALLGSGELTAPVSLSKSPVVRLRFSPISSRTTFPCSFHLATVASWGLLACPAGCEYPWPAVPRPYFLQVCAQMSLPQRGSAQALTSLPPF